MKTAETTAEAVANLGEQLTQVAQLTLAEEARVPTSEPIPPPRLCECGFVLHASRPFQTKTQKVTQWTCGNGHVLTERSLVR